MNNHKPCKDCLAEIHPDLAGTETARRIATRRPIAVHPATGKPVPGPRCATHHREATKAARTRTRNKRLAATYGLDDAGTEYAALYAAQGGKCYICERATGKTKALAVDHNHETGAVRGLLCGPCNRGVVGHLRDDVEALRRAITYLTTEPAQAVLKRNPPAEPIN